jgi:uncharacterized protein (DUF2461 family)
MSLIQTRSKFEIMNMKFFSYEHLPEFLQKVSKPFHDLAHDLNDRLPDCAEKAAGLRKLLESKDCFVRVELECADYIQSSKKTITTENFAEKIGKK